MSHSFRSDGVDFQWPTDRASLDKLIGPVLCVAPFVKTAQSMLSAGADPLHVLIESCLERADAVVAFLLQMPEVRARVNDPKRSESQYTALMAASEDGNLATVQLLLAAGADPNTRHVDNGMCAAWVASDHGRLEILRCLLKAGADAECPKIKPSGFRPTMVAAQNGHNQCLLALFAAGANPNGENVCRQVPLCSAYLCGHLSTLALLVKHGAVAKEEMWYTDKYFEGLTKFNPCFASLSAEVKAARRSLLHRAKLAVPSGWPVGGASGGSGSSSGGGSFGDCALTLALKRVWGKSGNGCKDHGRLALRRVAKAVGDALAAKEGADGLVETEAVVARGAAARELLSGKGLPPRLRFRVLFVSSRFLELRGLGGPHDALAAATDALRVFSEAERCYTGGDGRGAVGNKWDSAAAWLLEEHCVPRLVQELFGPVGSDARSALLKRQAPVPSATTPPPLVYCSHANWQGKAFRVGGRTFNLSGPWKVPKEASELWAFDPKRTARATGGDGSMDPWARVACAGNPPSPRQGAAAGVVGKRGLLVVWGGEQGVLGNSRGCDPTVFYALDNLGRASSAPSALSGRGDAAARVPADVLRAGDQAEKAWQNPLPKWIKVATKGRCPPPRANPSCCVHRGLFLVFGGTKSQGNDRLNDVWALDVAKKKWHCVIVPESKAAPSPRAYSAMWGEAERSNGCEKEAKVAEAPAAAAAAAEPPKSAPAAESTESFGPCRGGGAVHIFGGEVYPGMASHENPLDPQLGCVASGDFWRLHLSADFSRGEWAELPVLGDHPGTCQEAFAAVLPETFGAEGEEEGGGGGSSSSSGAALKSPTTSANRAVVLWGGYHCGAPSDMTRACACEEELRRRLDGDEPYRREVLVYQAGVWRRLLRLGDGHTNKAAQTWLLPVDPRTSVHASSGSSRGQARTFFAVGGYGTTGSSGQVENKFKHLSHAPSHTCQPELLKVWNFATLVDPLVPDSEKGAPEEGATPKKKAAGGKRARAMCSGDIFANLPAFTFQYKRLGGSDAKAESDMLDTVVRKEAALDADTPALVPPTAKKLQVMSSGDSAEAMLEYVKKRNDPFNVLWLVETSQEGDEGPGDEKKFMMNSDTYRGPFGEDVGEALKAVGWDGGSLLYTPPFKGPLFQPPYRLPTSGSRRCVDAMEAVLANHKLVDLPRATQYAASLSLTRAPPQVARLTLRIAVLGVAPAIWRRVRVSSALTLEAFHDQVLCPVFGYARNYHAYAFRKHPHPWLGPTKGTALDMAQVPFFVKALGSDRKVQLFAWLGGGPAAGGAPAVGATATYVHDLGDWIEHVVTLEACHGPGNDLAETTTSEAVSGGGGDDDGNDGGDGAKRAAAAAATTVAVAELLDGDNAGLPNDVGSPAEYVSKLNQLLGVTVHPDFKLVHSGRARAPPPEQALWWKLLNEEFRKKNAKALVFDPCFADLSTARFDLADALRLEGHGGLKAAAVSFPQVRIGNACTYDKDSNLPQQTPGPRTKVKPAKQKEAYEAMFCRAGGVAAADSEAGKAGVPSDSARSGSVVAACAVCGCMVALRTCSRCRWAHYCSAEHQKADWPAHKAACKAACKVRAAAEE